MPPLAELPKLHGLPATATIILDGLDAFAVMLDSTLSPVYANPAAKRNQTIGGVGLNTPEFLKRASRVLESGVTSSRDPHPDDPSDTVRTHILRIAPDLLVVLAEDLGEEQRLTAMRRDFIANVSHELKTPIAAIGLLSEAVWEAADDPVIVREFASSLLKEAKRLSRLSQDIIQLSEAQSELNPEHLDGVDLVELVTEEIEAHASYAGRRGVILQFTDDTDPETSSVINGRSGAIASAIANVLSNAIRHSPADGTVKIRVVHRRRNFTIIIKDQGEGIAQDQLERIFERFYRVDDARSRNEGGTGLGLSIARHSMRAHGGDVTVRSELGKGSQFTLTLPLGSAQVRRQTKRVKRARKVIKKISASSASNSKGNE